MFAVGVAFFVFMAEVTFALIRAGLQICSASSARLVRCSGLGMAAPLHRAPCASTAAGAGRFSLLFVVNGSSNDPDEDRGHNCRHDDGWQVHIKILSVNCFSRREQPPRAGCWSRTCSYAAAGTISRSAPQWRFPSSTKMKPVISRLIATLDSLTPTIRFPLLSETMVT